MLVIWIIATVLWLVLAVGTYCAAYHAIAFAAPGDRTRWMMWIYLFLIGALTMGELAIINSDSVRSLADSVQF